MDLELLNKKTEEINEAVLRYMPVASEFDAKIVGAMSYSLSAGGKRLRPLLMAESFNLFAELGKDRETLNAFMAALEYIHTYSLVHDDLPAMDNATLRRGKPATHVEFGEAFGVLAGDALLNRAFEIIAERMNEIEDGDELLYAVKAFGILSSKAGVSGMIGGQCLDVQSEQTSGFRLEKKQLDYIYEKKTGALIEAALVIGAVLARAGACEIKKAETVGKYIGYAFQIRDDILDIEGDRAIMGKDTGADLKNEKMTYVDFIGIDKARAEVQRYTAMALKELDSIEGKSNTFLKELLISLVGRNN